MYVIYWIHKGLLGLGLCQAAFSIISLCLIIQLYQTLDRSSQ